MTVTTMFDYLVRIAGLVALVLGLGLWSDRFYDLVGLHMALGIAAVVGLLSLAIIALKRAQRRRLPIVALVWGLATLSLGFGQVGILVGELPWLVQTAHLLLGLGSIALAAKLAAMLKRRPASNLQELR